MYHTSEADFRNTLRDHIYYLHKNEVYINLMETGTSAKGFPDIYIRTKLKTYLIELKHGLLPPKRGWQLQKMDFKDNQRVWFRGVMPLKENASIFIEVVGKGWYYLSPTFLRTHLEFLSSDDIYDFKKLEKVAIKYESLEDLVREIII